MAQLVSCDLIGHSGTDASVGSRYTSQGRDSNSLPLPPIVMGGIKYPSTLTRDSSSLPMHYSGGAEGSVGVGGGGGKFSPTPGSGSGGLSLHLNPTTLAMLQQHNFIPYFRGIKACRDWDQDLVQYRQWTICWYRCCCQVKENLYLKGDLSIVLNFGRKLGTNREETFNCWT